MTTRVVLYSHDAMGLGHMRRNLGLARALTDRGGHTALLVAGAREAAALPMPAGVECLALPALAKSEDGVYRSRSLDLPLADVLHVRGETIRAAVEAIAPDVMIVDRYPLGFRGELEPALEFLRARGRTRLVLGLRDILDDPIAVREELSGSRGEAAIEAFYDRVWLYGDPLVYDTVREYGFSAPVAAKACYTGYLAPDPVAKTAADLPEGRIALCLVGGGQDGAELADAFSRAALPDDMSGVIVAGPFMPRDARGRLHARAAARTDLRVLDFVREPRLLLPHAERVVAMGGYNTICELLVTHRPALVAPRERPRSEQLLRIRRLAALGLLDGLEPGDLSSEAVEAWLSGEPRRGPHPADLVDLGGLRRVPRLMEELLNAPRTGSLAA